MQLMQSPRRAVIVFVRYPEAGRVKSRLAADLGEGEAVRIYRKLVRRTLNIVTRLKEFHPEIEIMIYFDPPDKEGRLRQAYPGPWEFIPQKGAHLGSRMDNAITNVLSKSFDHALLIGTDIADLSVGDLLQAFEALEQGFAALGPAADGGFYLIGLNRPCPEALESEIWGTSLVFDRTERLLLASGFSVRRLNERKDVDRAEDLRFLDGSSCSVGNISVIVPTLNNPHSLKPFLASLEACLRSSDEIVVVHGGGGTGSAQVLSPHSRCIPSPRGRGFQLNLGAAAAKGDIFLFLHDDSKPPPAFPSSVRVVSQDLKVSLGCFELAFYPSTKSLELIADWANFRTRVLGLPYGDQGLFCRRDVFDKVGGFKKMFLMEDVDFVKRCRKWGSLAVVPQKLYTSSRAYLEKGILRTSLRHHCTMLLYRLGVGDKRLYSLYYRNH